ncbi:MAG TPA: hypothetical protein VLG09_00335, partial [Candidatus Saccharimonadales bacterium]|nr:hypothetical protein [Candidatus Saccharimonadales bacterium]
MLSTALSGATSYSEIDQLKQDVYADFDVMAERQLVRPAGMVAGDPDYDNYIDASDPKLDEYKAVLRRYSIDNISKDDWEKHPIDPVTHMALPSKRAEAVEKLRVDFPDVPTVPLPSLPPKTSAEIKGIVDVVPEIIAARTKVNVLREELAELSAKRQRRLFTRSNTLYEFDDKVDQYEKAVNELAKAELEAEKDAGKERDETEERFAAALKLVNNYRQLQELSVDKLKKTKVAGFIRIMTSGSTPMRMLKGLGLGVGVGLVAGALTAVTGGAAAAGAATALVAAGKFARSYARFDNEENRGVKIADASLDTEVVGESGATGKDTDETIDLVNKYLLKQLEEDMLTEQDKRRKATGKAMAMVVVGSLAGEALHYGHDLYTSHHAHSIDSGSGEKPGNGSGPNTDPGAGGKSEVEDTYHFDAEGQTLHKGDGFYSVFEQMNKGGEVNIPQKDWSALLEQAGPKLHDLQIDGHPLAYRMPNGEWGVRMTSDGMFPKEGMDIIASTHDHMTGVVTDNASHAADHIGDHASEAAPHNHASFDTDTSDTSAADADMTTEVPIAHNMIDSVLDKPVVSPSDISGNPTLSQLTHVIPDSHASYLADKLNLRPSEWQPVEEYIAHQTSQGRPLYGNVFNITTNGVVEFKTNTLPPATMADIITHIPTSVRSRL